MAAAAACAHTSHRLTRRRDYWIIMFVIIGRTDDERSLFRALFQYTRRHTMPARPTCQHVGGKSARHDHALASGTGWLASGVTTILCVRV